MLYFKGLIHRCDTSERDEVGTPFKRILLSSLTIIVLYPTQTALLSLNPHSKAFPVDTNLLLPEDADSKSIGDQWISNRTVDQLPRGFDYALKISLPRYTTVIRHNASAFGLDWRLIMAVMKQESEFDENAVSSRGAYGLMQVMPATGLEVASRLGLKNLDHPHRNIRGGTFYLAKLYRLFEGAPDEDRLRLAIAAYNAGAGRIHDAQDVANYLGENPFSWQVIEKVLPLLSKQHHVLHSSVWDGGKPRNGYFGKWRQTILYVQRVIQNYERYKSMLI